MAGPAGMNRATVQRATLGVLSWMREIGADASRGVVVGRDGRRGSEKFNDEVVSVLLGGGAVVYEMPSALPTPLVAYCVKALHAAAGIMITASHNPPRTTATSSTPATERRSCRPTTRSSSVTCATRPTRSSVIARVPCTPTCPSRSWGSIGVTSLSASTRATESDLAITYTPLHGVGGATMTRLFARRASPTWRPWLDSSNPTVRFRRWPFRTPKSLARWISRSRRPPPRTPI
jgi:phosphomannomutase